MTIYETAIEWKLKLIRWEFFATLTWDPRKSPKSRRKREAQVNGWVNEIAKWGGQTKNDIAYVNRWEHGEISGLLHVHSLLARFPHAQHQLSFCFAAKNTWRHGVAQVRLYEPSRNGEAYMTKGIDSDGRPQRFSAEWSRGANAYELKKFNNQDEIWFSPQAEAECLRSRQTGRRMLPGDYALLG
jgi:hypothetical protein